MHPGGPNAAPTVVGDKLITLSKDGQVFCFDAAKGTVLWKASLDEAAELKLPSWGFASPPGNLVVPIGCSWEDPGTRSTLPRSRSEQSRSG